LTPWHQFPSAYEPSIPNQNLSWFFKHKLARNVFLIALHHSHNANKTGHQFDLPEITHRMSFTNSFIAVNPQLHLTQIKILTKKHAYFLIRFSRSASVDFKPIAGHGSHSRTG
jgi:hypothetical protein